ncbi:MAG: phosphatidate cytidylyltransferase [Proteobacteria bacterium]|nr:phosphatidate cytidylyltransferase [Pseudomonadota bacterium]
MLGQRILTALLLIPLVLWAVFSLSPLAFVISSLVVFVFAALEWAQLCQFKSMQKSIFLVGFLLFCALIYWVNHLGSLLIGTLLWLAPLYWVSTYKGHPPYILQLKFMKALFGIFILAFAWQGLCFIRNAQGPWWLILLFVLVWACDTFAYFVGRKWGKMPLLSEVSPNKTIEGFLGGVFGTLTLSCLIYIAFVKSNLSMSLPFIVWLSISYVTILLTVLGDLFESLVKRLVNVKDSGRILPGHGGILDRIDSLVAALPFYALSLAWTASG